MIVLRRENLLTADEGERNRGDLVREISNFLLTANLAFSFLVCSLRENLRILTKTFWRGKSLYKEIALLSL